MEILDTIARFGIDHILWGILAFIVCTLVIKLVMKLFNAFLEHFHGVAPELHAMFKAAVKIILYFIAIMVTASIIGIPITSFLALFSVVGLAVSLSVQGVLSNLAGGIILLAARQFSLEDFIESDTISGTVKEIGFLHTKLLSPDGKIIYVPNSSLQNSRVINYTASGTRRIDMKISASYNNSPTQVKAACMSVVHSIPAILQDPEPAVVVDSYGDNAINYIIRVWTSTDDFWPTQFAINEALYDAFKQHGVEMTYPHINVHMQQ